MNMDVSDDEIPIPAYLRKQTSRDASAPAQPTESSTLKPDPPLVTMAEYVVKGQREDRPPSSTDDVYSGPRWVFVKPSRGSIHPRSLMASMLRDADRRRGATDSLTLINYGPVELAVRTWLARINWRRWWRWWR